MRSSSAVFAVLTLSAACGDRAGQAGQAAPGQPAGGDRRVGAKLEHIKTAGVRRVRGPRARHQRRRPDGRVPDRRVPEARPQAGQPRRHLYPEGAARRHHRRRSDAADLRQGAARHGVQMDATRSSRGRGTSPRRGIDDSDMVFVGYGVDAPEYDWNDFKGVDVKGKTIVVLVNDPPVPDPADPSSSMRRRSAARR